MAMVIRRKKTNNRTEIMKRRRKKMQNPLTIRQYKPNNHKYAQCLRIRGDKYESMALSIERNKKKKNTVVFVTAKEYMRNAFLFSFIKCLNAAAKGDMEMCVCVCEMQY